MHYQILETKEVKNMKRNFLVLLFSSAVLAGETSDMSFGFNFMAGGRYDNLRMCVATPSGVKGGPIADIVLNTRIKLSDNDNWGFKLPVMRPILFGLAFKMLQFEPEFIYEHSFKINDKTDFILGPGIGASFHWGPDYKTDLKTSDRKDFFAAGPFISSLFGFHFENSKNLGRIIGIRVFYTPLFSKEKSTGTVAGAAFEGHFDLINKK